MNHYQPITKLGLPELGIVIDSPEFQRWLEQRQTFKFLGARVDFKVRKIQRSWNAFINIKRQTHFFPMGATECITLNSLLAAEAHFVHIFERQESREIAIDTVNQEIEDLRRENEELKEGVKQWLKNLHTAFKEVPESLTHFLK